MQVTNDTANPYSVCHHAASLCGLHNQKYPDARPMGFPFDRPADDHIVYLNDFLLANMTTLDVVVKFLNKTVTSAEQGTDDAAKTKTAQ